MNEPSYTVFEVSQATRTVFPDVFMGKLALFFVLSGSKHVQRLAANGAENQDLVASAGDMMIFAPGSFITMENRPVMDQSYRAVGVTFSPSLVQEVFPSSATFAQPSMPQVQIAHRDRCDPLGLLSIIQARETDGDLPKALVHHRDLEPLIWLKHFGFQVSLPSRASLTIRVRELIETDLTFGWRAGAIAKKMAMSEPTLRRHLALEGQGFSKLLTTARLERGLALLQTTRDPISQIALACGFSSHAHFSDAFKIRFRISPNQIREVSD